MLKALSATLLLPLCLACHRPSLEATQAAGSPAPSPEQAPGAPVAPLSVSFQKEPEIVASPVSALRRGINLGNGFDAPEIGAWGVIVEETHFEMAQAAGLDHVRLPVRFSAHAQPLPPYTIDPEFFLKVDWAVEQALRRNLSIIVDLHHYEELMDAPDAHTDRFLGLWEQISQRYANRPPEVLFEVLNEPCKQLDPVRYNALLERVIPLIRQTNPERLLIIDSYFWAAATYLTSLKLPAEDEALVASFHMYQPILFTHQGASWMGPEYQTRGIVFPGPPIVPASPAPGAAALDWTRRWLDAYNRFPVESNPSSVDAVAREFDAATRFVKQSGRRVYLGEFGAIDHADETSRENYLRLVRHEAERRGFPWAIWDDGGRNLAMNVRAKTWSSPVARALFTDQPGEPLPVSLTSSN